MRYSKKRTVNTFAVLGFFLCFIAAGISDHYYNAAIMVPVPVGVWVACALGALMMIPRIVYCSKGVHHDNHM